MCANYQSIRMEVAMVFSITLLWEEILKVQDKSILSLQIVLKMSTLVSPS
jgi:hypothetical protein